MSNRVTTDEWLMAIGGTGHAFVIEGWHPSSFHWDIRTLHQRHSQLQKITVIFGLRPGHRTGGQPEMLYDQLPVPLLSGDSYVNEAFSPFMSGFERVSVTTGFVRSSGRFDKWGDSWVLVPTEGAFYHDPADIPGDRHMAMISNKFCISTLLRQRLSFYLRDVVCVPFVRGIVSSAPISRDYSQIFKARKKSKEVEVENRILQFVLVSLEAFTSAVGGDLGALLLDCDPADGYVIIALKQSSVRDTSHTAIDDFEFDRFAKIEESELYGEAEFLPVEQLRGVLERVIRTLTGHPLVKSLAGANGLHLAYAFHEEAINWMSVTKQDE